MDAEAIYLDGSRLNGAPDARNETYRAALRAFLASEGRIWIVDDPRSTQRLVREMGTRGLFRPCIAHRDGDADRGIPLDFHAFNVLIEELATCGHAGLTLAVAINVGVFLPLVARLADRGIGEDVTEDALRGAAIGAIAATEPDVPGSDLLGIETTVRFDDNAPVLNGRKAYVTNVPGADYVVVFARSSEGRHAGSMTAVLVPTATPGVRCARTPMAVMPGASVGSLEMKEVRLDPWHVLGRRGRGLQYFGQHIAVERLVSGLWGVPLARRLLAQIRQQANARVVAGKTLWERSAVRQRVGHLAARATLAQALVERATREAAATGLVNQIDAAVLKATIPGLLEDVVQTALQFQGAKGLEKGNSLLRLLVDVRAFGIGGGATEPMLELIADMTPGRPAHDTPGQTGASPGRSADDT